MFNDRLKISSIGTGRENKKGIKENWIRVTTSLTLLIMNLDVLRK